MLLHSNFFFLKFLTFSPRDMGLTHLKPYFSQSSQRDLIHYISNLRFLISLILVNPTISTYPYFFLVLPVISFSTFPYLTLCPDPYVVKPTSNVKILYTVVKQITGMFSRVQRRKLWYRKSTCIHNHVYYFSL